MDFILMLTRDDLTVEDCLDVVGQLGGVRVKHVGFKDVGVDVATLHELNGRLRKLGVQTYLEVVSTTAESALESARVGRELGVDWLMGGTWVAQTLEILAGSQVQYLPFPGVPVGHPTALQGTAHQVAADCRRFELAGAAGVDLLAYRATDTDPNDLVRAAREATSGRLVVAGNVHTVAQIRTLSDAGVDAFTVGGAAFAGEFTRRRASLAGQLQAILDAAEGSG